MTDRDNPQPETDHRLLIGFYADAERAQSALQELIDDDFPLDRVSLLGKAGASGDDPLGVYFPSTGDRMRGWGRLGAIWGGVMGMLGGAAGMFIIPGIGPLMIVGPVAEILVGTVAGAGLGGGLMASGAALSEVAVAAHRMGVPESAIEDMEHRLRDDQYMLLLIVHHDEVERWDKLLGETRVGARMCFPYVGLTDAAATLVRD
jgi:hypothetical protein